MVWVNLGQLQDTNPATHSLPLLTKTGAENRMKKLVGQDEGRKIIHQLPRQAKHTKLGEN